MSFLLLVLLLFISVAVLIARYAALPKNITVLFIAQPLVMSAAPIMVFIGGIISSKIAPNPGLATLPLSLMIAGTACATIPAAFLAKILGRKTATIIGFFCAFIGALLAFYAIVDQLFFLFVASAFIIGFSGAFAQQLRFAAIEGLDNINDSSKALSILMFTGIFSALIGPEVVIISKNFFTTSEPFAAAFLGLAILSALSMLAMLWFKNPVEPSIQDLPQARPIRTISKQPIFIIAILTGALAYGLMSFIMTSTPLSMHEIHGHALEDTKWVVQSHIAAMYLPSLLTNWLHRKLGIKYIMLIGTIMFASVAIISLLGQTVMHYWWALIMLGIAWNFLFFSGTSLLPRSYLNHEKHKVQAINDFGIFSFQGLSSLMAGWLLYQAGWNGVIYASIPFVLIMFVLTAYYMNINKNKK